MFVRNTFLDVEIMDFGEQGMSHRAAFFSEPSTPRARLMSELEQVTVDNLNELLEKASLEMAPSEAEQQTSDTPEVAEAKPSLKPVLSSMSVSTMATEDGEDTVSHGSPPSRSSIKSVASSATVSSMDSSMWEPLDDGSADNFFASQSMRVMQSFQHVQHMPLVQPMTSMQPIQVVQSVQMVQPTPWSPQPQRQVEQPEVRSRRKGAAKLSGPPAPPSKDFTHGQVPKHANLAGQFSQEGSEAPQTTMMVRNIPNRYTQHDLIEELESLGFAGTFDFLYAPTDFGTMGNVGYTFINFLTPEWAARCQKELDGYIFKRHQKKTAKKVTTVSVAHLQGLAANLKHYEKSAVAVRARTKGCGPVIMPSLSSIV